jgi:hypothetical protein
VVLAVLLIGVARKLAGRAGRWPALLAIPLLALGPIYAVLRPRNDRLWAADATQTPWAEIQGDVVRLHNYRNFEWRAADAATARWETKTVQLSRLKAVDLGLVYWGSPHLCHTLLSFDFGADGFVCASVEARREHDERYSPLAGIFRRYELLYVLGDEHDVLRLRTHFRGNDVYLFRLQATPAAARTLFLSYLESANALRQTPAWYHTIATNCTTIIRQHAQVILRQGGGGAETRPAHDPWSWRILANGHLGGYLYERGYVTRDLPLPELIRRSAITDAAQKATAEEFSAAIRAGRPGF